MKKHSIITLMKSTKPSKVLLLIVLVIAIIAQLASLVVPILTRELIDNTASGLTFNKAIIIAVVFIFSVILNGLTYYLISRLGSKMIANLRNNLWNKIIYLPITYFSKNLSGETVSRIVNDTNILKELVSERVLNFITGIITVVATLVILFLLDWQMTLIILVAIPLTALVVIPLGKKINKISIATQDQTAQFTGELSQSISEMRLVKASNAEKIEIKNTNNSINKLYLFGLKEAKVYAILYPLISGIVIFIIMSIIIYGGYRVSVGNLTSGTLIAFILYLFQIIGPITDFGTFFTQFQKAKGATQRIYEILEEDQEELDKGQTVDLSNKTIVFDNVQFNYGHEKDILKNINFKANANQTTAFVGPSGSGKSTIFALIERFFDPLSGNIKIDNMDIKNISLKSWRAQIGYVFQESAMFATTIRQNLTYGLDHDVSDDELWKVIELACAKEVIERMPDGFDTVVGERGLKLSGGERQRIAIARAFLRNPKILLLDEATASLDSGSEKVVQEALSNLMKDRTTLVIAHRLSTIVNSDKIIFVDQGLITGEGKHDELIANHKKYSEFAKQQLA